MGATTDALEGHGLLVDIQGVLSRQRGLRKEKEIKK